ncbi:hypothetical protein BMETH_13_9 [methanotrophic bacterial endosymbiont of Bathymodiolus sp.]|nr:hypothetical protein BMETH_13_9 [methanotrophic bacterial endosymbiont of Bathymodiolus sp.]
MPTPCTIKTFKRLLDRSKSPCIPAKLLPSIRHSRRSSSFCLFKKAVVTPSPKLAQPETVRLINNKSIFFIVYSLC